MGVRQDSAASYWGSMGLYPKAAGGSANKLGAAGLSAPGQRSGCSGPSKFAFEGKGGSRPPPDSALVKTSGTQSLAHFSSGYFYALFASPSPPFHCYSCFRVGHRGSISIVAYQSAALAHHRSRAPRCAEAAEAGGLVVVAVRLDYALVDELDRSSGLLPPDRLATRPSWGHAAPRNIESRCGQECPGCPTMPGGPS